MTRLGRTSLIALITPVLMLQLPAWSQQSGSQTPGDRCPAATASEPITLPVTPIPPRASASISGPSAAAPPPAPDYRLRLSSTPYGWPRLDRWCIWIEPLSLSGPESLWEQRWLQAVEAALARWQKLLPIRRVEDPAAAQLRIRRQRPPLRQEGDGRLRASHGRALLELRRVTRNGVPLLEPSVDVLISPGQRPQAMQATALHELGHALGLWGHSDQAGDAMATTPGANPILELSARDRATLEWLYAQPTRFGQPLAP